MERLAVAILVVLAAGGGLWWYFTQRPLMVPVAVLVQDVPVTVFGLGAIEARVLSRVGFEVPGTLVEVTVDHGDRVAVGAILARLNPASQEARVARADAAVLSAAAAAERAKAQRERAEAQLTQRLATARRRRDLARGGIGSQEMMMRKAFILALTLSTLTSGAFAQDPTTMPETGRVALYVTGASGNGSVEIHRPAAKSHGAVTANAGRLEGGADDNAVTRQGAAQSNLVERTQRSVPASDGGDDDIRVLGPAEGPRCGVGLGDEAFDSGLERDEGVKNAALQCLVSLAKKPSTALSQEALVGV